MVDVIGDNPMVIKPVKIGEASELSLAMLMPSLFTSNTVSVTPRRWQGHIVVSEFFR